VKCHYDLVFYIRSMKMRSVNILKQINPLEIRKTITKTPMHKMIMCSRIRIMGQLKSTKINFTVDSVVKSLRVRSQRCWFRWRNLISLSANHISPLKLVFEIVWILRPSDWLIAEKETHLGTLSSNSNVHYISYYVHTGVRLTDCGGYHLDFIYCFVIVNGLW
jgi:hypothetical protein